MIHLKNINGNNYDNVISLSVTEEQKKFVASNVYSLAQAKACPECVPLAVYDDEQLIGFAMYAMDSEDNEYWIYRLMVDQKFQSKGYGKKTMEQLISLIREDESHNIIYISFEPDNEWAKCLYEQLGFIPDGRIIGDEIVYKLETK